jgi:hypothetical protein
MAFLNLFAGFLWAPRPKPQPKLPAAVPPSDAEVIALLLRAAFAKPVGYWLCTHAEPWAQRSGFVPGKAYLCWQDSAGSYRIKPHRDSSWGPYWMPESNRFCYPDSDMRFTYLGLNLDGTGLDR